MEKESLFSIIHISSQKLLLIYSLRTEISGGKDHFYCECYFIKEHLLITSFIHSFSFQTTRLGVLDINHTSDKLKGDGHPDHITIMNISKTVDEKWKQLMTHAEERRAVVFSSYNFYRAAEQVNKECFISGV